MEALDVEGRFQPDTEKEVQFAISGHGMIAAVGNGDGKNGATYQGDRRKLFPGRALVVARTSRQGGPIHLTATTPGLSAGVIDIQARSGGSAPRTALT